MNSSKSGQTPKGRIAELGPLLGQLSKLVLTVLTVRVVIRLLDPLSGSIDKGSISLKVAGFELSAKQAIQQQSDQLEGLISELARLQERVRTLDSLTTTDSETEDLEPLYPSERQFLGRILWIDDNPSNNAYSTQYLRDLGYAVDIATSTRDAYQLMGDQAFDLIISDIGRTEEGSFRQDAGFKMTEELLGAGDPIPVIIYTSDTSSRRYSTKFSDESNVDILASPFELYRGVEKYLGSAK